MNHQYTLEEKLSGLDLYGLPCRVPTPTPAQAKCTHSTTEQVDQGFENWDGEWYPDWRTVEVSTLKDIPGTNNIRCTICGYTRRY